jgi:hypothetical protein
LGVSASNSTYGHKISRRGADKDSDKRQLAAIEAYAKAAGFELVETFYDAAVNGADPGVNVVVHTTTLFSAI